MASYSSYFINDINNLSSKKENMIIGKKYRFTILTERLIRLEYNEEGLFEDRATSRVIFRNFDRTIFTYSESDTILQISTKYFNLVYVKNRKFGSSKLTPTANLKVMLNETDKEWYYHHPEVRNFGTTGYSLDDMKDNIKLENGLYSMDGFAILDESNSYILDNNMFIPRDNKSIDIYLFMYKKDFGLCLKDYYTLTGYPSMLPKYALGNWWYKNEDYSYNDLDKLITNFKDNEIPLSNILLGNYWHNEINTYEFNEKLDYNNLTNLINDNNLKLGITIEPNQPIKNNNSKYNNIMKYMQLNNKDFNFLPFDYSKLSIYINDFAWDLDRKVDFCYIDYNNDKDRLNLWLLEHYHYVDNINVKKRRGLVLSRNTGIASHRYGILYSGKTPVSWKTLAKLPYFNLTAANMGISWWAHAIGGYYGGIEDGELFIRYIQFATFSPIFMLASDKGKYYKREPWKWNQLRLSVIKEYMQLREKLIPYIYNENYNYHKFGMPLIQPLYYTYPRIYDEPLYKSEYYFGSQMLVSPITKKKNVVMNRVVQRLFVPSGIWYDFKTGKKFIGNKYYVSFYKDEEYPVFCKAGSIIPLQEKDRYNIIIFPGANNNYNLYLDDGISLNSDYLIKEFSHLYAKDEYNLTIKNQTSNNKYEIKNYTITFRNTKLPKNIKVLVNNQNYVFNSDIIKGDLILELDNIPDAAEINITITGVDLEIDATSKIYEDIAGIIDDLEVTTELKEKIDSILFSNMSIRKKRIAIRKLKKDDLEPKFIQMFIKLLEYIEQM